jgi:hypothetical protein
MVTREQKLIYKMLTENTGTHMLDSGGIYGRNWQRNQKKLIKDFINESEEEYFFSDSGDVYRTVSVFHYLSGLELDELCDNFNKRNTNTKDWGGELSINETTYGISKKAANYLNKNYQSQIEYTFNTYNGESDLSQVLQGSRIKIFVDGQYEDYYLIQIHNGCDVRGGYTDAKLFKANQWSDAIHEYLWEYKSQTEIIEEITEGYITEMKDYYDNNKIWKHEEILKVLEKNNILN